MTVVQAPEEVSCIRSEIFWHCPLEVGSHKGDAPPKIAGLR
ncbi:Unknown protein sequence [Pseudomonas coronafaciens pv. oryzae]|nr:Unknown protein sequence [Pseudomonas coronafaciens pv. oryzae]